MTVSAGALQLIEMLGSGGMAEVWLARAPRVAGFSKLVAVKRLLPFSPSQGINEHYFIWEALVVSRMSHPNIVQVFDFFQDDNAQYNIVMEFVDGTDLRTLIKALRRPLPLHVAVYIIVEVLKGLGSAHNAQFKGKPMNLVHRDMSPNNILISWEGNVKVADFGVAKVIVHAREETAAGRFLGKPQYASREQIEDSAQVDRRSDIYSVGLVLYEMLGLVSAYGNDLASIALKHHGEKKPIREINPKIPRKFAKYLDEIIQPDRDLRPPDCATVRRRLLDLVPEAAHAEEELRAILHQTVPRKRFETTPFEVEPQLVALVTGSKPPELLPDDKTTKNETSPFGSDSLLRGIVPESVGHSTVADELKKSKRLSPDASTPVLVPRRMISIDVGVTMDVAGSVRPSKPVVKKNIWKIAVFSLLIAVAAFGIILLSIKPSPTLVVPPTEAKPAIKPSTSSVVAPTTPTSPGQTANAPLAVPVKAAHRRKKVATAGEQPLIGTGSIGVTSASKNPNLVFYIDATLIGSVPSRRTVDAGKHLLRVVNRKTLEVDTMEVTLQPRENYTYGVD